MCNCRTRGFATNDVSTEIKISIADGYDEENLFYELKKCVQNWNRRAEKHGGSRFGYCVEMKRHDVGNGR